MAETSRTSMPEPDNSELIRYIRGRLGALDSPPHALPADEPVPADGSNPGEYELG